MQNMTIRLSEEEIDRVDSWVQRSEARSRNAFVQEALNYYMAALAAKDAGAILTPAITTALDARLKRFEKNLAEQLFRVAVEQDMVNGILADTYNLSEEYLQQLKTDSIHTVKKMNGQLSLTEKARSRDEEDPWQA